MWPNPQETVDLVTFTEEILNGKLHFCEVKSTCLWEINPFSTNVPLMGKPGSWFVHKWNIGRKWVKKSQHKISNQNAINTQ